MNSSIQTYNNILTKVTFFFNQLKLKLEKHTGRKLLQSPPQTIALSLWKQQNGIPTKKAVWKIFDIQTSYKTLVVNMNRFAIHALLILKCILKWNQQQAHVVKHTDSTDIHVCLVKNANHHKTMNPFATWGHGPKGWYYGLKLSITTDLNRNLLAVRFATSNGNDRETFFKMNTELYGIFVGGYWGQPPYSLLYDII